MAISTAKTTLSFGATGTGPFTKLVDIISYPDMGSAPSKLDTTTLTEPVFKTSILGLQDAPDLTFECNYDETVYNTINVLTGTHFFKLEFGTSDGSFAWSGDVKIFAQGGGVDEVRKMTVVLSASTPIVFTVTP